MEKWMYGINHTSNGGGEVISRQIKLDTLILKLVIQEN